jgi:hypothetical protein
MAYPYVVPKFANETEEADWWYKNRHLVEQEFLTAAKEGRLKHGTLQRRLEESQARSEAETIIRLDAEDAQKARAAAEKRGMTLQPYVKMLLHEALSKEEAA